MSNLTNVSGHNRRLVYWFHSRWRTVVDATVLERPPWNQIFHNQSVPLLLFETVAFSMRPMRTDSNPIDSTCLSLPLPCKSVTEKFSFARKPVKKWVGPPINAWWPMFNCANGLQLVGFPKWPQVPASEYPSQCHLFGHDSQSRCPCSGVGLCRKKFRSTRYALQMHAKKWEVLRQENGATRTRSVRKYVTFRYGGIAGQRLCATT